MNLQLHRIVRTPHSEQYALFDLDRTDENYDPASVGKLDLHFADQAVYGTFLLWSEATAALPTSQLEELVTATLQQICGPRGIPAFYAVEYFAPELATYHLHTADDEKEGDQQTARNDGSPDTGCPPEKL